MNSYSISYNDNFSYEAFADESSKPDDIYVFVKFLGEGAFGKVNLYQNSTDNSLVVWKEINLKRLDTKMRNEAFLEVEILAILDHPNIISYYKHFIGDDTLYIELEYAKCGTLSSLIKQKYNSEEYFDQDTAVWYFYQLASAIKYIHELGIMHRDIKTLNIFIMHSGVLKLGDFGIAKILDDKVAFAESLVGTPLYMSPEIIEGKKYNFSSDIWSLGCVIYEILTLTRVFEATNQLKLAFKITMCDVNDIDSDTYSEDLKKLIKRLLSKDPKLRPTAKEILNEPIFSDKIDSFNSKLENLNLISKRTRNFTSSSTSNDLNLHLSSNLQNAIIASKLSEVYQWGAGINLPKPIDIFRNNNAPLCVSIGHSHFAVVTLEKELYTWAASHGNTRANFAKLGHGKKYGFTRIPKKVELNRVTVKSVACGDSFTVCLDDHGALYSFGTDYSGCLGLGAENKELFENESGENKVYTPVKIPFFEQNGLKVSKIVCGEAHCIALVESEEKDRIFTWGCGEHGRLGHGDENDLYEPTEIDFHVNYKFKNIFAGNDCSFLVTKEGKVLVFGNNECNKLLLNPRNGLIGFKINSDFEKSYKETSHICQQLIPKLVKQLAPYNIVKVSSGKEHTAVIDIYGRLWTFGSNKYGQLGVSDSKPRASLNLINGILTGQNVINVACGDSYTICCTSENQLFSWGNCKDGRLGLDLLSETNVLSPRPIFGSLHQVSEMYCCGWSSLIIAEKILTTKPVKSLSLVNYINKKCSTELNSPDLIEKNSVTENDLLENEKIKFYLSSTSNENKLETEQFEKFDSNDESTEMPDWIKKDLDEASFIPIDALKREIKQLVPIQKTECGTNESNHENPDDLSRKLKEALEQIEILKIENEKLRNENKTLTEQLNQNQ